MGLETFNLCTHVAIPETYTTSVTNPQNVAKQSHNTAGNDTFELLIIDDISDTGVTVDTVVTSKSEIHADYELRSYVKKRAQPSLGCHVQDTHYMYIVGEGLKRPQHRDHP
jgi:hypoxanthine phosphoribosyltransferase